MNNNICNYSRERFIYEINHSLTAELCNDIINKFNEDNYNDILYSSFLSQKWHRIHKCLKKELLTHVSKYLINVNKPFYDKTTNYNLEYTALSFNVKSYLDKLQFVIKKETPNKSVDVEYSNQTKIDKCINIFKYIWFLNEYDGELVFWHTYSIKPTAGKLLIFPISWCFPYEFLIKTTDVKYYITGQIAINNL